MGGNLWKNLENFRNWDKYLVWFLFGKSLSRRHTILIMCYLQCAKWNPQVCKVSGKLSAANFHENSGMLLEFRRLYIIKDVSIVMVTKILLFSTLWSLFMGINPNFLGNLCILTSKISEKVITQKVTIL